MSEFTFKITTKDGKSFEYKVRANEKLDAFGKIKSKFPDDDYELIKSYSE